MLINWKAHIAKIFSSTNFSMDLTQFLSKSQQDFFADKGTIDQKRIWKDKGTRRAETILKRKNKWKGSLSPLVKLIYGPQGHVVLVRQVQGSMGQKREPKNRPTQICTMIDDGAKAIQQRKDRSCQKRCWCI